MPGLLLVAVLTVVLAGCWQETTEPRRTQKEERHLVEVLTVASDDVRSSFERTGSLRLRRVVRIHNQEEGRITDLPWFEGDAVRAGELLVQLEDDLIRAELTKARATTRQARLDLKRIEDLTRRKAASQDELARARTALDIAVAETQLLEIRLGYTRIAAPFDGVVTERQAEPGDVVSQHSHLLTLADPQSMVVEVPMSELLLPLLAIGDPVRVVIDALGSGTVTGTIGRIHPALDPLTRQGKIEISFDRLPAGARAGQFARVQVDSAPRRRLMIPFGALRRDSNGEYVFLLNSHSVRRAPVRSGMRIKDRIEVLDGVEPGQTIVVRGFLGLNDGMQVEVVDGRPRG